MSNVKCGYCGAAHERHLDACPSCGAVNKFCDIAEGVFEATKPVRVEPVIVENTKPSTLAKVVVWYLIFSMVTTVGLCLFSSHF